MRRDAFGAAQPIDANEIVFALGELGLTAEDGLSAEIENFPDEEAPFKGWAVRVMGPDGELFTTLGLPSARAWEKELRDAGITDIDTVR